MGWLLCPNVHTHKCSSHKLIETLTVAQKAHRTIVVSKTDAADRPKIRSAHFECSSSTDQLATHARFLATRPTTAQRGNWAGRLEVSDAEWRRDFSSCVWRQTDTACFGAIPPPRRLWRLISERSNPWRHEESKTRALLAFLWERTKTQTQAERLWTLYWELCWQERAISRQGV